MPTDAEIARIIQAYNDNVLYDVRDDTAMAERFIEACRQLLNPGVLPLSETSGTASVSFDPKVIERKEQQALAWLRVRCRKSATSYIDVSNVRDQVP